MMLSAIGEDQVAYQGSTADRGAEDNHILMRGVVFGRSVRSSFCSVHVVSHASDFRSSFLYHPNEVQQVSPSTIEDIEPSLLRIQFQENVVSLRSHCRRFCKHGDLIEVVSLANQASSTEWQHPKDSSTTGYVNPRLVVAVHDVAEMCSRVRVVQRLYWSMQTCQQWQRQFLPIPIPLQRPRDLTFVVESSETDEDCDRVDLSPPGRVPPLWLDQPCSENDASSKHAPGVPKRKQGELITSFVIHMIASKLRKQRNETIYADSPLSDDPTLWAKRCETLFNSPLPQTSFITDTVAVLNQGEGVLDVAGGSGHVSMCMALLGIRSTVIDPRESVGKLPRRDRRLFHRAMNRSLAVQANDTSSNSQTVESSDSADTRPMEDGMLVCHPTAVPFESVRAWFGDPPEGVDSSFRHPDQQQVSIFGQDRIASCSAIVALHPDEATDAIVDAAVRLRKPFVVVPCCVFNRLFPDRRMQHRPNDPVSTYADLIDYLMAKDNSIQKATLPFEGSNTVLWSSF